MVFPTRRDAAVINFPLRNFETGDTERLQVWSHVVRNGPEIFTNHAGAARFLQDNAEIFLAFAAIRFATFRGGIVAGRELRGAAAGLSEHLIPIKMKKPFVSPWPPRECVNAIKSENMIDAEEMKYLFHAAHPLPPPIEIAAAHFVPAIKWDSPVLPPFLGELVVLEIRFRWCASAPIQRKFGAP